MYPLSYEVNLNPLQNREFRVLGPQDLEVLQPKRKPKKSLRLSRLKGPNIGLDKLERLQSTHIGSFKGVGSRVPKRA